MKIYIMAFKDEMVEPYSSEYKMRSSYKYEQASMMPDIRLFEGEVVNLVELPKDHSVALEIEKAEEVSTTPGEYKLEEHTI